MVSKLLSYADDLLIGRAGLLDEVVIVVSDLGPILGSGHWHKRIYELQPQFRMQATRLTPRMSVRSGPPCLAYRERLGKALS